MEQQKQECAAENAESKSTEIISRKDAKKIGLKRYFTGKPCKHGHLSERKTVNGGCVLCSARINKKSKSKNSEKVKQTSEKWRIKNVDKTREYNRRYRKLNRDKLSISARNWHEENKGSVSIRHKKYREENLEKIREKERQWRKSNKEIIFIRRTLHRLITNWRGGRYKCEQVVGYCIDDLRLRIEFQFKDGMNWDNYGEWHIDHKKPVSRFIKQGITDPAIINALSNLQPLWAQENLSKGAEFNA